MDRLVDGAVSIAVAIVGVALLAVLVSRNSNTAGVIGASGAAFSGALRAATGPVMGGAGNSILGLDSTTYAPNYVGYGSVYP